MNIGMLNSPCRYRAIRESMMEKTTCLCGCTRACIFTFANKLEFDLNDCSPVRARWVMDSRFADSDSVVRYECRKTREVEYPIESWNNGLCVFQLRGEERDENLYCESLEPTLWTMDEIRTDQTGDSACPENIFRRQRQGTEHLPSLTSTGTQNGVPDSAYLSSEADPPPM